MAMEQPLPSLFTPLPLCATRRRFALRARCAAPAHPFPSPQELPMPPQKMRN